MYSGQSLGGNSHSIVVKQNGRLTQGNRHRRACRLVFRRQYSVSSGRGRHQTMNTAMDFSLPTQVRQRDFFLSGTVGIGSLALTSLVPNDLSAARGMSDRRCFPPRRKMLFSCTWWASQFWLLGRVWPGFGKPEHACVRGPDGRRDDRVREESLEQRFSPLELPGRGRADKGSQTTRSAE